MVNYSQGAESMLFRFTSFRLLDHLGNHPMKINLQNLTARRSPNSYMITNTRGKVGRFCLFKSAYKLGEDIVGTFDFSVGTVTCMQVYSLYYY